MTQRLAPCPFCGAELERSDVFSGRWRGVYVHPAPAVPFEAECLLAGGLALGEDDPVRVAKWNRRAGEP